MFGWLKSKKISIFAPADGEVVGLEEVPDEVFSSRLAGDGVAIKPTSGIFVAPMDGIVSKIFPANHAFVIKNGDTEVIVHIGIDTVDLKGSGFVRIANEGDNVKAGDEIIKADLDYIANHARSTITPVVVSNSKIVIKQMGEIKKTTLIMEVE